MFLLSWVLACSCKKSQYEMVIDPDNQTETVAKEERTINTFDNIEINGVQQWILIRGNDVSKPILLYLHGGPGHSIIPFAHKSTDKLLDDFIIIFWDQRGAGLSYDENIPSNTMNIRQFIDDTQKVTDYLLKRFNKEKIFLLGHSWGSILGLYSVYENPEKYYAYIGVGQVINTERQEKIALEWLEKCATIANNQYDIQRIKVLNEYNWADKNLVKKYGGTLYKMTDEEIAEIKSSSPYFPEKYTNELNNKGLSFSVKYMWEDIKRVEFDTEIKCLDTPIYFFVGKNDFVTPTMPVENFYNDLTAPYKEIVWFENSGHRPDIEESDKFQKTLIRIGRNIVK